MNKQLNKALEENIANMERLTVGLGNDDYLMTEEEYKELNKFFLNVKTNMFIYYEKILDQNKKYDKYRNNSRNRN